MHSFFFVSVYAAFLVPFSLKSRYQADVILDFSVCVKLYKAIAFNSLFKHIASVLDHFILFEKE